MIDNVRTAMARMAAIRSTMGRAQSTPPAPAAPANSGATPGSIQAVFSQVLNQAGGFARARELPYDLSNTAGLTPSTGRIRSSAPSGLEGFVNGRIPADLMAPVDHNGERMFPRAASAFIHMRDDAARAGIALPIVDAYRSHEDQVRVAAELGLYRDGGKAAEPGTSQHGWGRAVDLQLDEEALAWMRTNGWKYGFAETVPREPWHWEFHPAH